MPNSIIWAVPLAAAPPVIILAWIGADTMGLILYALLLMCMVLSNGRKLYAVIFMLSLGLEIYGTAIGNWEWLHEVPVVGWTTMNPPLAAGTFYCMLDMLVVTTMNAIKRKRARREAVLRTVEETARGKRRLVQRVFAPRARCCLPPVAPFFFAGLLAMAAGALRSRLCGAGGRPVCWVRNFWYLVGLRAPSGRRPVPAGWKAGISWCLPEPIRSARPMRRSASRSIGQFSGSW
jgi:hypothetical protein